MRDNSILWGYKRFEQEVHIFSGYRAHSHGNITDDGKIGTDANKIIETTTGGLLTSVVKNTAYNRAFGTGVDQVAMGNHNPHIKIN